MKVMIPYFQSKLDNLNLLDKSFWQILIFWQFGRFLVLIFEIAGLLTIMDICNLQFCIPNLKGECNFYEEMKNFDAKSSKKKCRMMPVSKIGYVKM